MIFIDELQQSFRDFDELIHWFCDEFPEEDTINKEAEAFVKYYFPDVDLNTFWINCDIIHYKDAGQVYTELNITYAKDELQRCYPEYFL